ncbi:uncharacterized protein [Typha angustifolia]|uniref:uncharacterized protein n=1 Tax=Typha angustifolia TaxID=59011 RepID=UPI003C2B5D1D
MATASLTPNNPWSPPFCTIISADTFNFSYRACSLCERTLPEGDVPCPVCIHKTSSPPSKRLYRLLLSIATADKVIVVACFDRMARVLMGCSADELLGFFGAHRFAAEKAAEVLEGEMCKMTLKASAKGNAEHLRVVAVQPLRTGFRPVMETLRGIYGASASNERR